MSITNSLALLGIVLSLSACATGKSVKSLEDIQDDGERSVVLLTHDLSVHTTEKHSSVTSTLLTFRCPSSNDKLKPDCFSISVPYKGTKEVDGFGVHAFENVGAKAVKIKYDTYSFTSAKHDVVIDKVPETKCRTRKKTKKPVCTTIMEDVSVTHNMGFPVAASMAVQPGAGCYLGHLRLSTVDNTIVEYNLDTDAQLSMDKLANLPFQIATELVRVIDKPC